MSMTAADHIRADIDRVFTEHPMLRHAAANNAEVYAWFKQAQHGRCTLEEALIGALVRLADTNQKQFDEIIKLKMEKIK